jgi:hypothetical protein
MKNTTSSYNKTGSSGLDSSDTYGSSNTTTGYGGSSNTDSYGSSNNNSSSTYGSSSEYHSNLILL